MSNIYAPMGDVTIDNVFDVEDEIVYVVSAPSGDWLAISNPREQVTANFDRARAFATLEKAQQMAVHCRDLLVDAGARIEDVEFTVQQFTRTTVASDFHNVGEDEQ